MEHCEQDEDCNEGFFYYGDYVYSADDSKCSSYGNDCCACDASIGMTSCGWDEDATCDDGYVAVYDGDGSDCWYSCYLYDDNACYLFGTDDSEHDWCNWAWAGWYDYYHYAFYRASSDDTLLTFDGVTLFDQHLVDTLTFVWHDEGFSLEHTDGAQLPAFDVSAHGSDVTVAIASVDVTIDDFTLVELNSFTFDTGYNSDGTMNYEYGHYCSNYEEAEVLYDYDDWWSCMEHCDRDADCTGGHFYYGSNDYNYYDGGWGDNVCELFGTDDSDDNWCEWADDWCGDQCYLFYREHDDTQLILDGVTLFDQHLVDKLTFVNYDDGFSLEHKNGACLDADGGAADNIGDTCADWEMYDWREWCAYTTWDDSDFTASEMCCVCGGGGYGDDDISLEHTDGAQLPAFDISAHGSDVAVAIASFDVAIDNFTL